MPDDLSPARPARSAATVIAAVAAATIAVVAITAIVDTGRRGHADTTGVTALQPAGVGRAEREAAGDLDPAAVPQDDANLDAGGMEPGLASALEAATQAAAAEGIHIVVNDTYRSAEEQTRMFEEEVARAGSIEAARRRVFPASESMHVRGLAVDIGSGPAADWLDANGKRFGLCRTLAWEWWHFEWRPDWQRTATCPSPARTPDGAPRADPTGEGRGS